MTLGPADKGDPASLLRAVRIGPEARPFYIRRDGKALRAVLIDSPWGAPAARTERIDLAEPDLAALKLTLWLAYPQPADGKKRALEARKVLAQWAMNATGRIDPEFRVDRESRIGAVNRVQEQALRTVERVQIWMAKSFVVSVSPDWSAIAAIDGPGGVNRIAQAVAGREKRASYKTVLRDYWRSPAPVWHLAEAVFQAGGLNVMVNRGLDGDAASIRRLLEESEKNRRLGYHAPGVEIVIETIERTKPGADAGAEPPARLGPAVKFRPADAG